MLNIVQFREYVLRPALEATQTWSESAENLLLGTAIVESRLVFLKQLNNGPAIGLYQMEPNTYHDLCIYLEKRRPELHDKILDFLWLEHLPTGMNMHVLQHNLGLQTLMARALYLRVPEPLPQAHDISGLGCYYKKYYNTPLGRSSAQAFEDAYNWHIKRDLECIKDLKRK